MKDLRSQVVFVRSNLLKLLIWFLSTIFLIIMILKQKNDSGQKNSNGSDISLSYVRPFAFLNFRNS